MICYLFKNWACANIGEAKMMIAWMFDVNKMFRSCPFNFVVVALICHWMSQSSGS